MFKNGMMVFMVLLRIILLEIMMFGAMNGVLEIIISRNNIREFFEFLSRQLAIPIGNLNFFRTIRRTKRQFDTTDGS